MRARLPLERIFHPSDFSDASQVAFAHALKLALAARASFTILHIGERMEDYRWAEFPRVRDTLEKWRLIEPNSPREAIAGLGLDVEKVILPYADPVSSITRYLRRRPHDLIVLATHHYDGWRRLTHSPIAMPVARGSAEMTLFVPEGATGFVHPHTGAAQLRQILIAVDRNPDPQYAADAAVTIAEALGCRGVPACLLHVGDVAEMPVDLRLDPDGVVDWQFLYRKGNVQDEILQAAEDRRADLIVMSTQGRHGFLDALRGSTTERIVRNAKCPVLAAPTYPVGEPITSTVEGLATGQVAI